MADSDFWKARHAEFLADANRFKKLTARWNAYLGAWSLSWGWPPESTSVPKEALEAFNETARKSVSGLESSKVLGSTEQWRLWLDFMRKRKWRGFVIAGHRPVSKLVWEAGVKIERPPVVVRGELGLATGDEPEGDHWLEDLSLSQVFLESALCCEDLAITGEAIREIDGRPITQDFWRGSRGDEGASAKRHRGAKLTPPIWHQPHGDIGGAVTTAQFWGEREDEFRKHDNEENSVLFATWNSSTECWSLGPNEGCRPATVFKSLARKAAKGLSTDTNDALKLWLDALRFEKRNFDPGSSIEQLIGLRQWEKLIQTGEKIPVSGVTIIIRPFTSEEFEADRRQGLTPQARPGEPYTERLVVTSEGTISRLFRTSADFCLELGSRAEMQANERRPLSTRMQEADNTSQVRQLNSGCAQGERAHIPARTERSPSGRKANVEANRSTARIVEAIGNDWKDRLSEVCEALDGARVPRPRSDKWKKQGCRDWSDVLTEDREGLVKALQHRVDWVAGHPSGDSDQQRG